MRLPALLLFACLALVLVGCDQPRKTIDHLRRDIASYQSTPSAAKQEEIEKGFATLNSQITKLEKSGRTDESADLRAIEANLRSDYRAARVLRSLKDAQSAIQGIGAAIQEAGSTFGDAFRSTPSPTPH